LNQTRSRRHGEQWDEAGAHLRAVVPVRAEGLSEADELAGGEQLLELCASLEAVVARLEELASTPAGGSAVSQPGVEALRSVEASLASLGAELAQLRRSIPAPPSGGSEREAQLHARLDELPELVARLMDERFERRLRPIEQGRARYLAAVFDDVYARLDGLEGTVDANDRAEVPRRAVLEPRAAVPADSRLVATLARVEARLQVLERARATPALEAHATDLAERDARIAEPAPQLRLEQQRSGER
jgi:hypothetical protein